MPPQSPQAAKTILVVEDEEEIRHLVRVMLSKSGYAVILAENGKHAQEILQSDATSIHAILTDLLMPQMGGIELEQWASQHAPHMKMVFMSGFTDVPPALEQVLKKNHVFLAKPFTKNMLLDAVGKLFGGVSN